MQASNDGRECRFNPRDESAAALSAVLKEFELLGRPVYHMLGNHCLYNLPRHTLNQQLGIYAQDGQSSYYAFSPNEHWRFVVLDGYDLSMIGWPATHPHHEAAVQILDENNPNEVRIASVTSPLNCHVTSPAVHDVTPALILLESLIACHECEMSLPLKCAEQKQP